MMQRLQSSLRYILMLLCVAGSGAHAELTARLDRDRLAEGETVQLLLEVDGQVTGRPDTEPLDKDFDVLGVASGSRVNIINGRMDARTTWTVTLAPKRNGKLVVPSLQLNGERSPPLKLLVSKAPVGSDAAGGSPIFIETEVDRQDPYVQGMVRYTVRLFYRVKLIEGRLSEPQPENALLRRLGEDREYSVERQGLRYRVIERQYAVFPQASGQLRLPAPVLDARVPEKSPRRSNRLQDFFGRDPFDDPFFGRSPLADVFTSGRPLRVRGEARVLDVRARPTQADRDPWLPAQNVELVEHWQPQAGEVRVGEPITRKLGIRALGLTGEQLPDLAPGSVEGFKVYPDRAIAATRNLEQNVEGEKTREIAFVPTRPGTFGLPAVRLHWWDTDDDRKRVVELPGRVIEVLPAAAALAVPGQTPAPADMASSNAALSNSDDHAPAPQGGTGPTLPEAAIGRPDSGLWPLLSLAFALLWLLTLGVWWRGRQRAEPAKPRASARAAEGQDAGGARKSFLSACRANDAEAARRHLLAWSASHWAGDPPLGLDDIARRVAQPRIKQALADLDRALYGGRQESWDGTDLAAALTRLPRYGTKKTDRTPLPDLYT